MENGGDCEFELACGPPPRPSPSLLSTPFQSLEKKVIRRYKTEKEVAGKGRVS